LVTYRKGGSCTDFVTFISSGNFFEGLEPRETPDGRTFYKDAKQVTDFPEEETVEVQALMRDCTKLPLVPLSIAAAKSFMTLLNFDLKWKRGLEQRAADFSTTVSSPESALWPEDDPPFWTFDFTVKSQGVHLTDHLVIEIHSENQQLVTRLAVHL
jgi:hypothetical protein